MDENSHGGVYGAPLAAGHGDKSEAHPDVEPLAEAGARQDLGSRLGGLGGRVFSATFTRPSWKGERRRKKRGHVKVEVEGSRSSEEVTKLDTFYLEEEEEEEGGYGRRVGGNPLH